MSAAENDVKKTVPREGSSNLSLLPSQVGSPQASPVAQQTTKPPYFQQSNELLQQEQPAAGAAVPAAATDAAATGAAATEEKKHEDHEQEENKDGQQQKQQEIKKDPPFIRLSEKWDESQRLAFFRAFVAKGLMKTRRVLTEQWLSVFAEIGERAPDEGKSDRFQIYKDKISRAAELCTFC